MNMTIRHLHSSGEGSAASADDRGFAAASRIEPVESRVAPVLMINVVAFVSIAATLVAGLVSAAV